MDTVFIEATNTAAGGVNWGKFMVARWTREEWGRSSEVTDQHIRDSGSNSEAYRIGRPLLGQIGWSPHHITVIDLQTGEGAIFRPGGLASADLNKHRIWVCPLFEDFLTWLYRQDLSHLEKLPRLVNLDTESALYGYRRPGPAPARAKRQQRTAATAKEDIGMREAEWPSV
jgi:hypothetical protein